jgi:UDP-2,3-diacylglucosamine hydrolase
MIINGKCYFASDFHFGSPNMELSNQREDLIIHWLDLVLKDGKHLFLLGDIFDYWFEYRCVVPKGNYRFLAKLHEIRKKGIEIYYFTGNHDMWVKNYLVLEFGIQIFRNQKEFLINGKTCMIGHGDGLGPGQYGYKFMRWMFSRKFNIWLYGLLPSSGSFAIAKFFSKSSRAMTPAYEEQFLGEDKEFTILYIKDFLKKRHIDYFVYGHRHLALDITIQNSRYVNTGDWLKLNTYMVFDQEPVLCTFNPISK